tara:strand:+ start:3128 stop:3394 length:267 start_codon:yes stop_codon:yes gene_type:complete
VADESTRAKVLLAVLAERERQDAKWGDQTQNPDLKWNAILVEEVGEISQDILDKKMASMLEEIIQSAAVCIAWAEAFFNRGPNFDAEE